MSIANSRCAPNEPLPEVPDLLRRINALLAAGGDVLLFRQSELYNMKALVSRYTLAHVRFAVDLSLMMAISTADFWRRLHVFSHRTSTSTFIR